MLTLLVFFQICFQTPKPSTNFTGIYTANFLLHVDILGAPLGFNICKHICTCCTLKKIEAENGFLASCQYPRCLSRFQQLQTRFHMLHIETEDEETSCMV